MDGAKARYRYSTFVANLRHRRVRGREHRLAAFDVNLGESVFSADLGSSSKYSNENFEGRSGEGFHENSNWTWVSRS